MQGEQIQDIIQAKILPQLETKLHELYSWGKIASECETWEDALKTIRSYSPDHVDPHSVVGQYIHLRHSLSDHQDGSAMDVFLPVYSLRRIGMHYTDKAIHASSVYKAIGVTIAEEDVVREEANRVRVRISAFLEWIQTSHQGPPRSRDNVSPDILDIIESDTEPSQYRRLTVGEVKAIQHCQKEGMSISGTARAVFGYANASKNGLVQQVVDGT